MRNLITAFVVIFVAIVFIPVIKTNSDIEHDIVETFIAVGDGVVDLETVTLTYVTFYDLELGDVLVNGVEINEALFNESGVKNVIIEAAGYSTGDEITIIYVYEDNTYGDSRVFVDLIPLFLVLGLVSTTAYMLYKSKK